MADATPHAIFLSYASQDAEAARRMCEALRAAGLEVWFDQRELRGGDTWDQKIRQQIKECALFVAVVSANTQSRREAYFRLEWKLADERTHLMAKGTPFLLPVSIDATTERGALVPDSFLAVQWTRLPDGETTSAFCGQVTRLLGGPEVARVSRPVVEITGQETRATQPVGRRVPAAAWATVAVAVVACGVGGYAWLKRPTYTAPISAQHAGAGTRPPTAEKPAPTINEKSLVVLPLENLSPDPENAFFTDGMHAEIISTLARIPDLKVISRASALTLKDLGLSLAEAANRALVTNVMTGSVSRAGKKIRIQLELRRANDEKLLWSRTYAQDLDDPFALQSDIAESVARALQVRESKGGFAEARFTTKSPEAFDLFLRALDAYPVHSKRYARVEEAITLLESALKIAPDFVTAAHVLSGVHVDRYQSSNDFIQRAHYATEARRWAETAAQLAPGGAGDLALSFYHGSIGGDATKALITADNAIRAMPNHGYAHDYRAIALFRLGRLAEGVLALHQAQNLDPLEPIFWENEVYWLGQLRRPAELAAASAALWRLKQEPGARHAIVESRFMVSGELPVGLDRLGPIRTSRWLQRGRRFEEADVAIAKALASPNLGDMSRFSLLCRHHDVLSRLARPGPAKDAALAALVLAEKFSTLPEYWPSEKNGWLALAWIRTGQVADAVAAGRKHVEAASGSTQIHLRWKREIDLAEFYAQADRPRECVELVAKLLRVPSGLTVPMLKVDPTWDNVREDAGFKALLADPKNSAPL